MYSKDLPLLLYKTRTRIELSMHTLRWCACLRHEPRYDATARVLSASEGVLPTRAPDDTRSGAPRDSALAAVYVVFGPPRSKSCGNKSSTLAAATLAAAALAAAPLLPTHSTKGCA